MDLGASPAARLQLRWGTEQSLMNKGEIPGLAGAMLSRGTSTLSRQQVQDGRHFGSQQSEAADRPDIHSDDFPRIVRTRLRG